MGLWLGAGLGIVKSQQKLTYSTGPCGVRIGKGELLLKFHLGLPTISKAED